MGCSALQPRHDQEHQHYNYSVLGYRPFSNDPCCGILTNGYAEASCPMAFYGDLVKIIPPNKLESPIIKPLGTILDKVL